MFKRLLSVLIVLLVVKLCSAQLKSPEEFLGYKVGTKFTPHWKIVDYFKSVAAAAPAMVRLEQYGQTNEGRPLMVAYISSDAHISNLENIRKHNLFLAKQSN